MLLSRSQSICVRNVLLCSHHDAGAVAVGVGGVVANAVEQTLVVQHLQTERGTHGRAACSRASAGLGSRGS